MIKIESIKFRDKQETIFKYYTHPQGLKVAIDTLRQYHGIKHGWDVTAYLVIDGVYVCHEELDEFFHGVTPTLQSCESFLLSIADDIVKQSKMGEENVREINEQEVDRGFLAGYTGNDKTRNNPYYNQGYQSGQRCA